MDYVDLSTKFKNSSGARYLKGLFYEETGIDKATVLYSLKDVDHKGYPSLYRLYMEANDLTEYRFATTHFDGWEHWEMLLKCSWFEAFATRWRYELELRTRSQALASILDVASDKANPTSYHANKYILDGAWKPAGASKRGRPTKDEIKAELQRTAASEREFAEDALRIGLTGLNS